MPRVWRRYLGASGEVPRSRPAQGAASVPSLSQELDGRVEAPRGHILTEASGPARIAALTRSARACAGSGGGSPLRAAPSSPRASQKLREKRSRPTGAAFAFHVAPRRLAPRTESE